MKMYWKPRYKYQLLDWFKQNYSAWNIPQLKRMPYKQLYAIYCECREGVKDSVRTSKGRKI